MMKELTLTGATLNDHSHDHGHGGGGGSCEHDHGAAAAQPQQQHGAPAQHGGHYHSHAHGGGCCAPQAPQKVHVVYTPPTEEEINKASNGDIRESLETLIRVGGYNAFEPLLTLLLEKRPSVEAEVLNQLGGDHYSLMHWAAKRADDSRFIQLLCEKCNKEMISMPSSDKNGMAPMHWAATDGAISQACVLLKNGANLEAKDNSGCTPLLIAAQYGHPEFVALLLQRGANGRAVDKSRDSALHWAAYKGSVQVCGLLVYRNELSWSTADTYNQTPLHLASLRGNTSVVRYLLQQGTPAEAYKLLNMADKNGKTPYDLAVSKKKPTVAMVLKEEETKFEKNVFKQIASATKQVCSYHSWQLWMGCFSGSMQDVDVAPKFPLYFMVSHVLMYTMWFPLVFTPVFNTSAGILWDYTGWLSINIVCCALLWYFHYKTYTTNPGVLNNRNPETAKYRRLYEETIESYSDETNAAKPKLPLCHTCHIAKPLRSKHCRDARACVLMFDHHCPFVGSTIGLLNYKWFYLTLLMLTLCITGFDITLYIYLQRQFSWPLLIFGVYISLFILFAGGMLGYHTQLTMVNLTTNEHHNLNRYKYMQNEHGVYRNPFFKGWLGNTMERFFPTPAAYTLPAQQESLLANAV